MISEDKFVLTRRLIIYVLPSLAFGGVIFSLFLRPELCILGIYLAVPVFLAIGVNLKLTQVRDYVELNEVWKRKNYFLIFLYFVIFLISLYLLYLSDIRPIQYYLMIVIMFLIILCEILILKIDAIELVLVQIILLNLNLVWGVSLHYYYFISRTDPLAHAFFIENLIKEGYVTKVFDIYESFPLWHILCAIFFEISNINIQHHKLMFLISGILSAFSVLLVYLITYSLSNNKKLALLSSLIVCFNQDFIVYSMASLPRSTMLFFGPLLLILILKNKYSVYKKFSIIIFLTFIIISYHPASINFILIILFIIYILINIYSKDKIKNSIFPIYFLIATLLTLGYWMYYSGQMFEIFVETLFVERGGILLERIQGLDEALKELVNYTHNSILLFFVLIGVLESLRSRKMPYLGKIICLAGLIFVFISLPGPHLIIEKFFKYFNLTRFGLYTYIFICFTGAVGIYEIFYKFRYKFFIIFLLSVMVFLSISNDFVASDNPIVKRNFYTFYLTEKEVAIFDAVGKKSESQILSDYVTWRFYRYSEYKDKAGLLELDEDRKYFLKHENEVILLRIDEMVKRPLKLYSSGRNDFEYIYINKTILLYDNLNKYSKIFDSNVVVCFI